MIIDVCLLFTSSNVKEVGMVVGLKKLLIIISPVGSMFE